MRGGKSLSPKWNCFEFPAQVRPASTQSCGCEPRASVIRAVVWAACQELSQETPPPTLLCLKQDAQDFYYRQFSF